MDDKPKVLRAMAGAEMYRQAGHDLILEEAANEIERLRTICDGIDVNKWIKVEDIKAMVEALAAYRAEQWWFRYENDIEEGSVLSPMQLGSFRNMIDAGVFEANYNTGKVRNLLKTALYYRNLATSMKQEEQS